METGQVKKIMDSQTIINTWLGHLFGALIFLIIWFTLYQFVLIHSLEPWQAFVGSITVAAIFEYLADFHGYKWLVDKLLRYSPSKE